MLGSVLCYLYGGNMNRQEFYEKYDFDYDGFFTMVKHVGPTLNERKNRFDKADVFESGLEKATKGKLEWVDQIGYDMICPATRKKFEVKSQGNVLYTKGGNIKPKNTSDIKLTNTMQNSEEKDLRATADYLIIIDSTNHSMAIISYKQVVDNYSTELSDGFKCQIPIDKLEFLVRPGEVSYLALREDILNYAGEKKRIQDEYTSQFF